MTGLDLSRSVTSSSSSVRRVVRVTAQVGVLALALIVWWYGSVSLPTGVMPSPVDTFATLGGFALTPHFWATVWETVWTFLVALVICTVVGVPLGLAIGSSRIATQSTRLVFDFLRTIPPIAILPLVLLIFGPTFEMVLVVVVLGAIWPILIQSVYAAQQGEPLLTEMSRSFRVPRRWFITRIFFPGSLPFIMTGLRVGTTICLLLTITGELLSGAPGIGFEIADAKNFLDTPRMYAYVLVSALLGLIVNGVFWIVQRRVLRWHASNRQDAAA
ncbi:MAG TPA: ABC transporter permease [Pseudolysinimonas sp.]|nr:ABC transporter permease [Pseudolysinimonas sp.]